MNSFLPAHTDPKKGKGVWKHSGQSFFELKDALWIQFTHVSPQHHQTFHSGPQDKDVGTH